MPTAGVPFTIAISGDWPNNTICISLPPSNNDDATKANPFPTRLHIPSMTIRCTSARRSLVWKTVVSRRNETGWPAQMARLAVMESTEKKGKIKDGATLLTMGTSAVAMIVNQYVKLSARKTSGLLQNSAMPRRNQSTPVETGTLFRCIKNRRDWPRARWKNAPGANARVEDARSALDCVRSIF